VGRGALGSVLLADRFEEVGVEQRAASGSPVDDHGVEVLSPQPTLATPYRSPSAPRWLRRLPAQRALWWPEQVGTHSDIDLSITDPNGVTRAVSDSGPSVFELARVNGPIQAGEWKFTVTVVGTRKIYRLLGKAAGQAHTGHVTENPDVRGVGPEPISDLEYDLAHEAGISDSGGTASPTEQENGPMVYVATETTGYDGDYGYDLAHDVPRP